MLLVDSRPVISVIETHCTYIHCIKAVASGPTGPVLAGPVFRQRTKFAVLPAREQCTSGRGMCRTIRICDHDVVACCVLSTVIYFC